MYKYWYSVWAEQAISGNSKTALEFKYEIWIG